MMRFMKRALDNGSSPIGCEGVGPSGLSDSVGGPMGKDSFGGGGMRADAVGGPALASDVTGGPGLYPSTQFENSLVASMLDDARRGIFR